EELSGPKLPGRPDAPEIGDPGLLRKKLRIIVVDDELIIAETLAEILNGEGCEAFAVSSGAAAVELARKVRPDVVISDVIMPDMNGIETARLIRLFLPTCRMVLFSGQASTSDLLKEARTQGNSFELLNKPIRPSALLAIIGSCRSKQ
ncbi:MAG: response regulator, partial [Candidatus Angelobacter sp.]